MKERKEVKVTWLTEHKISKCIILNVENLQLNRSIFSLFSEIRSDCEESVEEAHKTLERCKYTLVHES